MWQIHNLRGFAISVSNRSKIWSFWEKKYGHVVTNSLSNLLHSYLKWQLSLSIYLSEMGTSTANCELTKGNHQFPLFVPIIFPEFSWVFLQFLKDKSTMDMVDRSNGNIFRCFMLFAEFHQGQPSETRQRSADLHL